MTSLLFSPPMRSPSAFTLVELLVTISIVAILAGVIFSSATVVRMAANRAVAMTQMRQIGTAIQLYAGDHDGDLPGPLDAGQGAMTKASKPGQLATLLGPYLGVTSDRVVLPDFLPPAYTQAMSGQADSEMTPFVMNLSASASGTGFNPWGNAAKSGSSPMKLMAIPDATVWGFADADQTNPLVKGMNFASKTPALPIHGPDRLAWSFDGSVATISTNTLCAQVSTTTSPSPKPPKP